MTINFKSIISGSSGNSLLLWTDQSKLLIDCGFSSQKKCREHLEKAVGNLSEIDAVLATHAHSDHINYSALRVMEQYGIPLWAHQSFIGQIKRKYLSQSNFDNLQIHVHQNKLFSIKDFEIHPVRLKHHPKYPSYGFIVTTPKSSKKIVIMTDFFEWQNVEPHLINSSFIYLEANYDHELLEHYPNPNSHFHLSNDKAADLISRVVQNSDFQPQAIMLGHLSEERNHSNLALESVQKSLRKNSLRLECDLMVAPRFSESPVVEI